MAFLFVPLSRRNQLWKMGWKIVLTYERAYVLSKAIFSDKERTKELLRLNSDEITNHINALGYDYNVEEIREYCNAVRGYMSGHAGDNISD